MSLLAQQQQHELDSSVLTRIVHRHCLTQSLTSGRGDGDCWPAASMVLVASRGRRWCWWLAGVVSCQLWYPASVVLVAGHHHQGCLLQSGPWSLNLLWSRVAPLILLSQRQSCNGVEWSKDKTQAAESIKWRPQQAYGSNQFLLVQPQTVFSTHTKSSRSRIDKRTARATGNTRYRYSKIAPLDHKMADNCVSLARTNTLSSTITKPN